MVGEVPHLRQGGYALDTNASYAFMRFNSALSLLRVVLSAASHCEQKHNLRCASKWTAEVTERGRRSAQCRGRPRRGRGAGIHPHRSRRTAPLLVLRPTPRRVPQAKRVAFTNAAILVDEI